MRLHKLSNVTVLHEDEAERLAKEAERMFVEEMASYRPDQRQQRPNGNNNNTGIQRMPSPSGRATFHWQRGVSAAIDNVRLSSSESDGRYFSCLFVHSQLSFFLFLKKTYRGDRAPSRRWRCEDVSQSVRRVQLVSVPLFHVESRVARGLSESYRAE